MSATTTEPEIEDAMREVVKLGPATLRLVTPVEIGASVVSAKNA
jgi:hypothetical protein